MFKEDPKSSFDTFFQILSEASDVAFPEVDIKPKNSSCFRNPWMSSGLLVSSKTKNKLYCKKLNNPSNVNINNFQTYNVLFNKCKRNAKKSYYSNQFEIRKENVKQTWSLIRDVIGSKTKKN